MLNLLASLPGNAGGNGDILRESAIAVHADNLDITADVALSGATLVALATGNMSLRGDKITRGKRGDFTPNLYNHTRKFMSEDTRDPHATLCPGIPLINVNVRATDRGGLHLHQDIPRANLRNIDESNRCSRRRLGFEGRLHFTNHCYKGPPPWDSYSASIMRLGKNDCKVCHRG